MEILKTIGRWLAGSLLLALMTTLVGGVVFSLYYKGLYDADHELLTDSLDQLAIITEKENYYEEFLERNSLNPDSNFIFTIPEEEEIGFPLKNSKYLFITSPFGKRNSPFYRTGGNVLGPHEAIDLASSWKAEVFSAGDGTVTKHFPPPNGNWGGDWKGDRILGGMIEITLDNGLKTVYGHLSETYVREGKPVKKGQVLGRIGNTGLSTGQHLHFEVWKDGVAKDPLEFLSVRIEAVTGWGAVGKVTALDTP